MTAQDSHLLRHELYISCACVASHATYGSSGFRQRDVRFMLELFSNWSENFRQPGLLRVQNTQLMRYLAQLARQGYAQNLSRSRTPRYRLTRVGLLELVTRIVDPNNSGGMANFPLAYYFIANYKARIETLIKSEGAHFPYSLKIELDALLNPQVLLDKEFERTHLELKRVEQRIEQATEASQLVLQMQRRGDNTQEIIQAVQKRYPYDLNSQKPLSQLMAEIVPEQRLWELNTGNVNRARQIWHSKRVTFRAYLGYLKELT